jgi:hypothetical protein
VGAVLLADHEDRAVGRDLGAVACALAALTFSGLGISVAVALAASVALRRGLRSAALLVAPAAAAFAVWYLGWGHESSGVETTFDDRVPRLVGDIVQSTLARFGAVGALGWAVGLASLAGLVLLGRRVGVARLRREQAPVLGLLVGAAAFLAITGVGRAHLSVEAATRYRHVLAALLLPAIGVGLTELGRRWPPATWIAVAVLVTAIPANVADLSLEGPDRVTYGNPGLVVALANVDAPPSMPRTMQPLLQGAPEITVGWLEQARDDGKVPGWDERSRPHRPWAELVLALEQVFEPVGEGCRPIRPLEGARLSAGQVLRVPGDAVTVVEVVDGQPTAAAAAYQAAPVFGPPVVPAEDGPEVRLRARRSIVLQVRAPGARGPSEVCTSA